jgi:Peptidase family C25/FlgD Ig-like domain
MFCRKWIILLFTVFSGLLLSTNQLVLEVNRSVSEFPEISGFGNDDSSFQILSGRNSTDVREIIANEGSVIKIPDTENFINSCLPILPQINLQINLQGYVDVNDVNVISGQASESNTVGKILSHFQPVEWSINSTKNVIKRSPDPKVYDSDNFFPGRWLDFTAGYDGKQTKVFIQLYPFQWNPKTQEVIFLQEYSISVNGIEINIPLENSSDSRTDATHLIISPSEWLITAATMADFHEVNGISTDVIDLADIAADYVPVEEPTEPGYANTTNPVNGNYDYELAKKIISYLRDTAEHPNLEMITLLGSGEFLPPSYYFFNQYADVYSAWIPSDQYYSSPDYDWVDNFAICRVPVHNEPDLITYLEKMEAMNTHLSEDWVQNVTLAGGDAFDDDFYTGEMIDNMAVCLDLCDEMNIEKYQRYENRFSKNAFENHVQNDDYLMHLHICHGSGDEIHFDSGSGVSGVEMLSYPAKERLPIFLTVACMNGAFDTQLHSGGFSLSFSEGLIASPGAGIAYVGGSRSNGGIPSHYIDQGNLEILGIDDTALLLLEYMQAYRETDEPTIGGLAKAAKEMYLSACNMNYVWVKAAYTRFVCQGSAAFQLPVAPVQNPETIIPLIASNSSNGVNVDGYQISEIQYDEPLYFGISDNETHDLQSVHITNGGSISIQGEIQSYFELDVPFGQSVHLNKVINEEEKEAWHYSVVYRNRLKHVDGNLEDWALEEVIASDPSGDISPGMFDLSLLYMAYDEVLDDLYFAFPEALSDAYQAEIYKVYYILAFDDETGGFSNNFADMSDFPVNCYLGFEGAEINKMLIVTLTSLNGDINSEVSFQCYDQIDQQWNLQTVSESAVVDGGVEIRLPAALINYQYCQASFVSSIWEILPTQQNGIITDAVPTDPACPETLLFGVENAVSVSEYFDFEILTEAEDLNLIPQTALLQNYPNPFNPNTTISFSVESDIAESTELIIFNLKGQKVRQLVKDQLSAGQHSVDWNGKDDNNKQVSSGVYFYKLSAGKINLIRKMVLIK